MLHVVLEFNISQKELQISLEIKISQRILIEYKHMS